MEWEHVRWGPRLLVDEVADQLVERGLGPASARACVEGLQLRGIDRARLFVDLGNCRLVAGDVAGALAAWRQALSGTDSPEAGQAAFNLGLLHEQLDLPAEAEAALSASIERDIEPWRSGAELAQARLVAGTGQLDTALAMLATLADRLRGATSTGHPAPAATAAVGRVDELASDPLAECLIAIGVVAATAGHHDHATDALDAAARSGSHEQRRRATAARSALVAAPESETLDLPTPTPEPGGVVVGAEADGDDVEPVEAGAPLDLPTPEPGGVVVGAEADGDDVEPVEAGAPLDLPTPVAADVPVVPESADRPVAVEIDVPAPMVEPTVIVLHRRGTEPPARCAADTDTDAGTDESGDADRSGHALVDRRPDAVGARVHRDATRESLE